MKKYIKQNNTVIYDEVQYEDIGYHGTPTEVPIYKGQFVSVYDSELEAWSAIESSLNFNIKYAEKDLQGMKDKREYIQQRMQQCKEGVKSASTQQKTI